MKKILIGLFAMSVASFSTLTPTDNAQDQSNLWETGQEGRISVKGNFVTTPSDVKYVIFTSPDGTLNGADDTLVLPTLTMSQNYNIPTMKGTPQKIYVKKLNNDGTIANLTDETVTFRFSVDPYFTKLNEKTIGVNASSDLPILAFLSYDVIKAASDAAFPDLDSTINPYAEPIINLNGQNKTYRIPRQLVFAQNELGVLETFMNDNGYFKRADTLPAEYAVLFENQFKGAGKTGEIAIKVKVDIPTTVTP